jgi:hypothetical protein
VQGYDVYRDGTMLGTVPSTSYADVAVSLGGTHVYAVLARGGVGNTSGACNAVSATVPAVGTPTTFSDGFESGSMGTWSSVSHMRVGSGGAFAGAYAAQATTGATGPTR